MRMSFQGLFLSLLSIALLFVPMTGHGGEHSLSVGFGIAVLSSSATVGKIEDGRDYNFFQLAYAYETNLWKKVSFLDAPFWKKTSLLVEPFAAYVNQPNQGVDTGLELYFRCYPYENGEARFFFDAGVGAAYTTNGFHEQGTHLLGILAGGIGVRYKNLFIVDRLRHYSNGGTSYPNRSINANVISVGMYF